jgi:hypothetical protein
VIVVDAGRIVERGPHVELVDAGGVYAARRLGPTTSVKARERLIALVPSGTCLFRHVVNHRHPESWQSCRVRSWPEWLPTVIEVVPETPRHLTGWGGIPSGSRAAARVGRHRVASGAGSPKVAAPGDDHRHHQLVEVPAGSSPPRHRLERAAGLAVRALRRADRVRRERGGRDRRAVPGPAAEATADLAEPPGGLLARWWRVRGTGSATSLRTRPRTRHEPWMLIYHFGSRVCSPRSSAPSSWRSGALAALLEGPMTRIRGRGRLDPRRRCGQHVRAVSSRSAAWPCKVLRMPRPTWLADGWLDGLAAVEAGGFTCRGRVNWPRSRVAMARGLLFELAVGGSEGVDAAMGRYRRSPIPGNSLGCIEF